MDIAGAASYLRMVNARAARRHARAAAEAAAPPAARANQLYPNVAAAKAHATAMAVVLRVEERELRNTERQRLAQVRAMLSSTVRAPDHL